MSSQNTSLDALRLYTVSNVGRVVADDPALQPFSDLIRHIVPDYSTDDDVVISKEAASRATKYSATETIPEVLSGAEVAAVRAIARFMVEAAVSGDSQTRTRLIHVAEYLHPLLSQDSRTEQIGWDLEEYMDWYFSSPSKAEREAGARELLADWQLDQ